jgi:hypothetical protein
MADLLMLFAAGFSIFGTAMGISSLVLLLGVELSVALDLCRRAVLGVAARKQKAT